MSELLYTIKENGLFNGFVERDTVHTTGILHATLQCWVMNEKGQVLVQKRAITKKTSPGLWDVSFGGHCTKLDDPDVLLANVIKEGKEEIGIDINKEDIITIGSCRYASPQYPNRELITLYLIKAKENQAFTFNDGEVEQVKWIDLDELEHNMRTDKTHYASRLKAVSMLKFYLEHGM